MNETPVVLWQLAPCWGLPNPSPFCLKLETWLRMTGIPYRARAISGPPKSANKKIPYLELDNGELLADSSVIIQYLSRQYNISIDKHLSVHERATGRLLQRCFEESLYFGGVYNRWIDDANRVETRDAYFATLPKPVRWLLGNKIHKEMIKMAHAQGIGRLPQEYREQKAREDLDAISEVLGDNDFFFSQPSTIDAVAYGFLANLLWAPTRSASKEHAKTKPNLVSYTERMKEKYWANRPGEKRSRQSS